MSEQELAKQKLERWGAKFVCAIETWMKEHDIKVEKLPPENPPGPHK